MPPLPGLTIYTLPLCRTTVVRRKLERLQSSHRLANLTYSFTPNTNPNVTMACNQSFIYQTFNNFSQQYYANENQEVAAVQQWLKTQANSNNGLTPVIRQGILSIQNQHNEEIKSSVQSLNSALSQSACPNF